MNKKNTSPRIDLVPVLGLLIAVAMATSAPADTDLGWKLRFQVAAVDMEHGSEGLTRPGGTTVGYGGDVGGAVGFNAEYRFSERLGIDLGVMSGGSLDIEAHTYRTAGSSWVTNDTLTFTPLTAGLAIHLTPESRVDLYACPLVALIQYGTLDARVGPGGIRTGVGLDEDFALGAAMGLGVPLGQGHWSFQANLMYLDSSLEGTGADGLRVNSGFDITAFGLGLGYRFGG